MRISAQTLLRRVIAAPPTPLQVIDRNIPVELVAICETAMARDPRDRYEDMIAMVRDLRAYLEDRVVRAHRTGAFVEFRKWFRRNQAMAISLLVAAVLAIGGLGGAALYRVNARMRIEDQNLALREVQQGLLTTREELEVRSRDLGRANAVLVRQRDTARRQRDDIGRLSDLRDLRELKDRERHLWPAHPDHIPEFDEWIALAESLSRRLDLHRSTFEELRRSLDLADPISTRDSEEFTRDELEWWLESQRQLLSELETFVDPEAGTLRDVRERLELANSIEELTIDDYEEEWVRAIDAIASSPYYAELEIEPQIGLVPLGPDPHSELWEFLVWGSGVAPQREGGTGRWQITGETGVILVLVPGGEFSMGSSLDPRSPNYDPQSKPPEKPVHEVTLAPFFLSKYEMTQGQWVGVMGQNPSEFTEGNGGVHPVEHVNWKQCSEVLLRLGLRFPTEAQWEFAARAGTNTPWPFGADRDQLVAFGNVADEAARGFVLSDTEVWNDGYTKHAPSGSFDPNGFGLHDMQGNVWEWCLDTYADYSEVPAPGDGLRGEGLPSSSRHIRGGAFTSIALAARSAYRGTLPPTTAVGHVGCRAAAELSIPDR